jgi:hypothetical protein
MVSCLNSSEKSVDFQQIIWPYIPDHELYSGCHKMDEVVTGISLITDHPTGISTKYALALPLPLPLPILSCSSMGPLNLPFPSDFKMCPRILTEHGDYGTAVPNSMCSGLSTVPVLTNVVRVPIETCRLG